MEYNKSNIDEIVGRVIRNTRVQDLSLISDIFTWITEAMADMRTKWVLQMSWAPVKSYFHKAPMPCGLVTLTAVEYNGTRLPQRNLSRHASQVPPPVIQDPNLWISMVKTETSPNGFNMYLQETRMIPIIMHTSDWYQEDGPGSIITSFAEGDLIMHYKSIPTDAKGFPVIPDQENYKEALYWYCRMKMIESGWQDPVLNWETCDAKYNINAERGIAATRYPSTNKVEEMCDMITLIPPQNYFDTYGNFYNNAINE